MSNYSQKHYGEPTDKDVAVSILDIISSSPYHDLAVRMFQGGWNEDELQYVLDNHALAKYIPDVYKVKIQNAFRDVLRGITKGD